MDFLPFSQSTPVSSAVKSSTKNHSSTKRRRPSSPSTVPRRHEPKPKLSRQETSCVDGECLPRHLKLHQEIVKFVQDSSPSPEERKNRELVIERVTKVVKSLWSGATVEVFGSYKTDLYLPTCDIDIVIFGKWPSKPFYSLKEKLVEDGVSEEKYAQVLDNASVPIIKVVDKQTGIRVDITFNAASGLASADQIKQYLAEYPSSRSLIIVLKRFLSQRSLNEVYTGGVSSYGLMLMVISFLQLHPRGDGKLEKVNLGVLLTEFFELYGCHFNYLKAGIKLNKGPMDKKLGSYFPRAASDNNRIQLSIHDPAAEEESDVLRGSYNYFEVRLAFQHAYRRLSNELLSQRPTSKSILSLILNLSVRDDADA